MPVVLTLVGVLQMIGFRSVVMGLALAAASTFAQAAVYTTRADWNAAVAGHVDETIPDLGAFQLIGFGDAGVTYGTLTYVQSAALGGNALMLNVGPGFSGQPAALTSSTGNGSANIRIDLPGFFKAIAFDFGTSGGDIGVKLSNGSELTASVPDDDLYSAKGFLGLVEDAGFQSVLITTGGTLALRNASYGDATAAPAPVPEPMTWALMLLGFGGLGAMLRIRRSAPSSAVIPVSAAGGRPGPIAL